MIWVSLQEAVRIEANELTLTAGAGEERGELRVALRAPDAQLGTWSEGGPVRLARIAVDRAAHDEIFSVTIRNGQANTAVTIESDV